MRLSSITRMSDDDATARGLSADRSKAFVDAVVAIAMTLLILPLMDSVGDSADADHTTGQWLADHHGQLQSFVISFVIIAMFWLLHHRLFTRVTAVSQGLMWLTMAWMLTIVWMPVVTALTGQVADDPLQKVLYIGTLVVTSVMLLITRLYLARHPQLHELTPDDLRIGVSIDLAMIALWLLALGLSLAFPVIGYASLLVMFGTGAVQGLIVRLLRRRTVEG